MSVDNKNIPNHIAIIPDGNRRWAKKRGLEPWDGHEEGAKNTEKLMLKALELGVSCVSLWGSSLENLQKRPLLEKKALLRIYQEYFTKLIDNEKIHSDEVRINFIGKWEQQFPKSLKKVIRECIDRTKAYKKNMLNFFLAYSGDDEMIEAVRKIVASGKKENEITAEFIKNNLFTSDLPPVDYLIRTGGEPHLSAGFMMWDLANAQLYFSEKMYPDFREKELEEAIEEYQRRKRRLGK